MTARGYLQIAVFLVLLLGLAKPLGTYMAKIYGGERTLASRLLGPVERVFLRAMGVRQDTETDWKTYAFAMLFFNVFGLLAVYALQRLQASLPLNPQGLPNVTPDLAFNTATSFATNTNWQSYGGETTLGYLVQMLGLTVQNFVSAASGMAVLVAVIRGFTRKTSQTVGCFWVDLVRGTLYVLLPISIVFAVFLISQGCVQTFAPYASEPLLQITKAADGSTVSDTLVALGPAASQIAIKDLGTNGGGFFNANSAHPLENPTPLSNFVITLSILLIPAALCHTFGRMVKDARQGWALLGVMFVIWLPLLYVCVSQEQAGNPAFTSLGIDQVASALQAGGNMEGKEARFGISASALYACATTAASNGSVNSMHDSFTPLGGLVPMWLIQLGEIVFGGVGSGLYGMLMFAVIAVFVSGLMVGRTPEYLGKKIEGYEMKMASLVVLVPAATVLVLTALAVVLPAGNDAIANPGEHGFSEVLYAFSSAANNNGSAFGGLTVAPPDKPMTPLFYNTALGIAMWLGRFWIKVPVLALAGALAKKKLVPPSAGTLPTHNLLFVVMLVGVVVIVGALTFIPALALGPIVEHLHAHP